MRQYIVGSWNDADSYDYSGEQIGNRQGKSACVDHVLPNGKANLARYADNEPTKPQKKKIPIASKILSQNVTLNRLDAQEKELDEAYNNSEIDLEEYEDLLYVLEGKRDRAHKSLCKALGRGVEAEEAGQPRVGDENVSESTKTQQNYAYSSTYGSTYGGGSKEYVKNFKNDVIYLLTGSVVGLMILLTLTNN